MRKGVCLFLVLLILILPIVSASWFSDIWDTITGKVVENSATCVDSDGNLNYYIKGSTQDNQTIINDACMGNNPKQLSEAYCENENAKSTTYDCPNGCSDGACLCPTTKCNDGTIYGPEKCNVENNVCICPSCPAPTPTATPTVTPIPTETPTITQTPTTTPTVTQTPTAIPGIKNDQISEKIFCGFTNSQQEQKCYTAEQNSRAYCSGIGSCVADIKGFKGEQITWKSSCGEYQYTTMDGNDEKVSFDCKAGETKTEEIKNKGFRNVYFQCYDGAESKSTDREACKSYDYWKKFAGDFCGVHCENNLDECKQKYGTENKEDENVMKCLGKCGVNTFSIGTDCYLEGTSIAVEQVQLTESTTIEPALICKDSCPLDGKCYLMGYRKSGKYCSDSGGFTDQLEGDKACDNNFECSSNVCVSGRCISEGLLQKILDWFKNLFG